MPSLGLTNYEIEQPSLLRSINLQQSGSISSEEVQTPTDMSMIVLVTAVKSDEFDLADSVPTFPTPFFSVLLNKTHETSQHQQITNISSSIRTAMGTFPTGETTNRDKQSTAPPTINVSTRSELRGRIEQLR